MNTCSKHIKPLIVLLALVASLSIHAQGSENDDMYFTKKDRKKVKYDLKSTSNDSRTTLVQHTQDQYEEEYSAREVNPDYIAKYRAIP